MAAFDGRPYSKGGRLRARRAEGGMHVLFKGPDTVIFGPSGACASTRAVYDAACVVGPKRGGDVLAEVHYRVMAAGTSHEHAGRGWRVGYMSNALAVWSVGLSQKPARGTARRLA